VTRISTINEGIIMLSLSFGHTHLFNSHVITERILDIAPRRDGSRNSG